MSLQEKWFAKEKAKLFPGTGRKGKRQYLHFDNRILHLTRKDAESVWNPGDVAKHDFYPFIRFTKSVKRYKRIPGTRKSRRETKLRPIEYAAHFDALIYSWYSELISERYESRIAAEDISDNVIAYRSLQGRNNVDFASEVFDFVKTHPTYVVAAFDVKDFYGTINHKLLKKEWRELFEFQELPSDHYKVYHSLTTCRRVAIEQLRKVFGFGYKGAPPKSRICTPEEFRDKVVKRGLLLPPTPGKGIPQGSTISCVLSNVYMLPLDKTMVQHVSDVGGMYRRYSDDIIVIVPETGFQSTLTLLQGAVDERQLRLNGDKTEKRKFSSESGRLTALDWTKNVRSDLQYLGLEFDGENVRLRHAGIAKTQRRAAQTVRRSVRWARRHKRPVPKNMLLTKFTRRGKDNYLAYADRAAKQTRSKAIRKQTAEYRYTKGLKRRIKKQL